MGVRRQQRRRIMSRKRPLLFSLCPNFRRYFRIVANTSTGPGDFLAIGWRINGSTESKLPVFALFFNQDGEKGVKALRYYKRKRFFLLETVVADCCVNELYKPTVTGWCTVSPHCLSTHTSNIHRLSLSHTFLLLLLHRLLLIQCISLLWL